MKNILPTDDKVYGALLILLVIAWTVVVTKIATLRVSIADEAHKNCMQEAVKDKISQDDLPQYLQSCMQ